MEVKVKWCFYIAFQRREWFKNIWWCRGGNALDIQLFGLQILIGLPNHIDLVKSHLIDYQSTDQLDKNAELNKSGNGYLKMIFTKRYKFSEVPKSWW